MATVNPLSDVVVLPQPLPPSSHEATPPIVAADALEPQPLSPHGLAQISVLEAANGPVVLGLLTNPEMPPTASQTPPGDLAQIDLPGPSTEVHQASDTSGIDIPGTVHVLQNLQASLADLLTSLQAGGAPLEAPPMYEAVAPDLEATHVDAEADGSSADPGSESSGPPSLDPPSPSPLVHHPPSPGNPFPSPPLPEVGELPSPSEPRSSAPSTPVYSCASWSSSEIAAMNQQLAAQEATDNQQQQHGPYWNLDSQDSGSSRSTDSPMDIDSESD